MMTSPDVDRAVWELRPIAGQTLRPILETMREVEKERMPTILRAAGMERYDLLLPPASSIAESSAGELSRLYASLYAQLGESLTRSFLSTYGRAITERAKEDPGMMALRGDAQDVPAGPERLAWSVRTVARLIGESWSPMTVAEDPDEFRISLDHCLICARLPSARAPLCSSLEVLLTGLIRELSGTRATALEYECHATGAERCSYRVRR